MLLHRNLRSNAQAVTAARRWTQADRLLLTLPLFRIHGLGVGVHGTLLTGGRSICPARFEAAKCYDARCWRDDYVLRRADHVYASDRQGAAS